MGGRIYAVALNTFREAGRNKILYGVIVAVAGFMLFAMVLGEMSLHEEARVTRDVGLGVLSLFGCLTAIILGVLLLYAEIQRKTIHTILAKPIDRWEFVLGKYVGMALTLTVLVGVFTLALLALLRLQGVPFSTAILKAVVLAWFEVLVVAAIGVFFSSFSTPYLSGLFTLGLYALGNFSPELRETAAKAKLPAMRLIARGALRVLPDLHVFAVSGSEVDGKHVSVHGTFVTWGYVGNAALYALALVAILIILAALIFHRRDFA